MFGKKHFAMGLFGAICQDLRSLVIGKKYDGGTLGYLVSGIMLGAVYAISFVKLPSIVVLIIQVLSGVAIYIALSAIFRLKGFRFLMSRIKPIIKKILRKS